MIIDRSSRSANVLDEAMTVVNSYIVKSKPALECHHWVCEICGLPHSESAPAACDGCGAHALTTSEAPRREMFSRW